MNNVWHIHRNHPKTSKLNNFLHQHEEKDFGITGNIFEYNGIVSVQFNQLKGKLFNLIDATTIDADQRKAMKGLIKDFCNSQFKNIIGDMEGWMERMGFDIERGKTIGAINVAEPLNGPSEL